MSSSSRRSSGGQARRSLATWNAGDALGIQDFRLNTWPEGLAVFTPHRLVSTDTFVLRRALVWNWRRRVGLAAEIERVRTCGSGSSTSTCRRTPPATPPAGGASRRRARPCGEPAPGDRRRLQRPARWARVHGAHRLGLVDAWSIDTLKDIDGSTNWTPGERRGRPPTQRLDFVFVAERVDVRGRECSPNQSGSTGSPTAPTTCRCSRRSVPREEIVR